MHLVIADLAGGIHTPRLDRVVVIDRARAAHFAQLPQRWLHESGVVDHARLEQGGAALPRPADAKARQRLAQHGLLQNRGAPVAPAVGRYVHAPYLAAARPREPGDFVKAAVEQRLPAGRRGDHTFRFLDPRELPVHSVRHEIDVVQRFFAREPGLVADFDTP
jgi:hypothetical protein